MTPYIPQMNNSLARIMRWINGETPLPERYKFGVNCKNDHAIKGKTVRRLEDNRCLICDRRRQAKSKALKDYPRNPDALHAYEDRLLNEDIDPLFDGAV